MSFNDFVILTVGKNDYRIYFGDMTQGEAVNRIKNADLSEKNICNIHTYIYIYIYYTYTYIYI